MDNKLGQVLLEKIDRSIHQVASTIVWVIWTIGYVITLGWLQSVCAKLSFGNALGLFVLWPLHLGYLLSGASSCPFLP